MCLLLYSVDFVLFFDEQCYLLQMSSPSRFSAIQGAFGQEYHFFSLLVLSGYSVSVLTLYSEYLCIFFAKYSVLYTVLHVVHE